MSSSCPVMPRNVRYLHVGAGEGVASVWGPGGTGSGAGAGHQVNSGQVSGVTSGSWSSVPWCPVCPGASVPVCHLRGRITALQWSRVNNTISTALALPLVTQLATLGTTIITPLRLYYKIYHTVNRLRSFLSSSHSGHSGHSGHLGNLGHSSHLGHQIQYAHGLTNKQH